MSLPESDMAAASLRTCIVCVSCNIDDVVEMLSYSIWAAFIAHTNCMPSGQVDIEEEPWCFSCIGFVTFFAS